MNEITKKLHAEVIRDCNESVAKEVVEKLGNREACGVPYDYKYEVYQGEYAKNIIIFVQYSYGDFMKIRIMKHSSEDKYDIKSTVVCSFELSDMQNMKEDKLKAERAAR